MGWWIILLLLALGGGWGGGFGGGFGGYGNMMLGYDFPWLLNGQQGINNNVSSGFRDAQLSDSITSVRDGVSALATQLCGCCGDMQMAIAECQGERNPNANTCIKLAAYYTIRQEMFGVQDAQTYNAPHGYSTQGPPGGSMQGEEPETVIDFNSGSKFSTAVNGKNAYSVWTIMDELMDVLNVTNPRLFNGVIRKVQEI